MKPNKQQIHTTAVHLPYAKEWTALRREMGLNEYGKDPEFFKNPDNLATYYSALERFHVEWEKRGHLLTTYFMFLPDKTERNIFKKNWDFIEELPGYCLIRCSFCGEVFPSKKFSTKQYCSKVCKRQMDNERRNRKKGIIKNDFCANPRCKKSLAHKRAGAKTCSLACRQAIKRL